MSFPYIILMWNYPTYEAAYSDQQILTFINVYTNTFTFAQWSAFQTIFMTFSVALHATVHPQLKSNAQLLLTSGKSLQWGIQMFNLSFQTSSYPQGRA